MNLEDFLQLIRSRSTQSRWGIGTADHYLREVERASDGGFSPKLLKDVSEAQWSTALKDAESQLVYCDDSLVIGDKATGNKAPESSVMSFDAIISSTKMDRDGDILESLGAVPDMRMPLLWQHISIEPIGKLLEITGQNSRRVRGRFAIVDTQLGRDAAVLVEFGALRISHGFMPLDFEPLDEKEGDGWRVKKYEIMETSLVSVPSNTDAVITAMSRGKLHHPLVKTFAQSIGEGRPVPVNVPIDLNINVDVKSHRDNEPDDRSEPGGDEQHDDGESAGTPIKDGEPDGNTTAEPTVESDALALASKLVSLSDVDDDTYRALKYLNSETQALLSKSEAAALV